MRRAGALVAAALALVGCNGEEAAMEDLAQRVRDGLVWIEGGTFLPGNYEVSLRLRDGTVERREIGTAPPRAVSEVALDGFYVQSLLPTGADYRLFRDATGLPEATDLDPDASVARMPFHEAEAFCLWLGGLTGLPLRLPTEDEWEFAARSRVLSPPFGTDDGEWERGRNVWKAPEDAGYHVAPPAPGTMPPSPLGLYDLHGALYQWVSDRAEGDPEDHRIAKGNPAFEDGWTTPIPSRFPVAPMGRDALDVLPHAAAYFPEGVDAIHRGAVTARCVASVAAPPEESGFGRRPPVVAPPAEPRTFRAVYPGD